MAKDRVMMRVWWRLDGNDGGRQKQILTGHVHENAEHDDERLEPAA